MVALTEEKFEEQMDAFAKIVKDGFDSVDTRLDGIDGRLDGIDGRLDGIDGRLKKVEATMVTKDYLDEKMADLRGDLVVLMRKEDTKLKKLIETLRSRNVLDDRDVQEIVRMEPFAALQP